MKNFQDHALILMSTKVNVTLDVFQYYFSDIYF